MGIVYFPEKQSLITNAMTAPQKTKVILEAFTIYSQAEMFPNPCLWPKFKVAKPEEK